MSTTHTPTHMPEPWRLEMGIITASDGTLFMAQRDENTQRVLECVNAMDGIRQPSDFMECLLDTLKNVKQMYEDVQPAGGYQGVYEGVCAAIDDLSRNFKNQTNE